jgi:acyl-CoA synthetase (NDP forming)
VGAGTGATPAYAERSGAAHADRAADLLEAVLRRAREEGRTVLGEVELFPALEALGWRTPRTEVAIGPGDLPALEGFSGSRVVVKLLSPLVPHRSDVGGVRVVAREAGSVASAVEALSDVSPDPSARFAVQEFVPHGTDAGGELLLGARWTDDFGPVVTVGLGGVAAEALSATGAAPLLLSPEVHRGAVEAALGHWLLEPLATGTLRGGGARVTRSALASAAEGFLDLAARVLSPGGVVELEANPVTFLDGVPVALDALARVAGDDEVRGSAVPPASRARTAALDALLRPGSLAVVGASATGENPGRAILRNVLAAGFPPSRVQVVKPGLDELDGCRCVPGVTALDPVDLLVVSVAAADVPALMDDVVRKGCARSVILIPGGLGEGTSDAEGSARIRRLLDEAGDAAPAVNGPNCLGIRSRPARSDTLFIPREKLGFPEHREHPVALVSQSGAFAIARASALPWLSPRYVVTAGNQLDVTVGEYLEHLVDDEAVRVFACYVEGFRPGDGARFLRAARRLRAQGRAVILYRAGRTRRGAVAAVSHTASVAGDYAVTRALAREAGVLLADRLDAFDDWVMTATLLADRSVGGAGLGALSNAGFECVALADAAGALRLPSLAPGTTAALAREIARHRLDGIVAPRNPMDVTPIMSDAVFVAAARAVLGDPGVDVGAVGCVPLTPALHTLEAEGLDDVDGVAVGLATLWRETRKAWVAVVDGGPRYDAFAGRLLEAGIPTFRRGDRALAALGGYVTWRLGAGAPGASR